MSPKITNDLHDLLKDNIITPETAEKIKSYYSQKESGSEHKLYLVFGVLGAILIGLGVVLVFAHNWNNLSRPSKIILSFLPLLMGQFASGYSLLKKSENNTWRESSAVFLFFAVGTTISLLAQVYNIPGDLSSFLITWMLLCLPLVYLIRSSIVSLLYLIGITYYACNTNYFSYPNAHSYYYWLLILGIVPHYIQLLRTNSQSNFTLFHNWFVSLSLLICLGTIANKNENLLYLSYMSLFTIFYFIGESSFFKNLKLKNNSYLIIGKLGILYLLLLYSFKWFWDKSIDNNISAKDTFFSTEFLTTFLLTLFAAVLFYGKNSKTKFKASSIFDFVFLTNILPFISGYEFSLVANGIVLAIGIAEIKRGITQKHLGILNFGLVIITILIACRFFDTNLSFVIRGIVFIAIGFGFFATNYIMLKNRNRNEK